MKKLMRLLAMTLAAAMLLSVGALAAGNESGGPRLVWVGLDWDDGHFANDDVLSGRIYGDEELHMAAGDDRAAIFFTIGEDGKRTPVIPTAGKGVTIEKMAKDEIKSGAKQSDYYVRVRLDDWIDSEITSGKTTMKVVAELPDVGFYTTAEATQKSLLRIDQQPCDPSQLKDSTVYFVRDVSDDPNQRQVTDLKKSSNGNSRMYDLEKVSDNVWKITLKIPEDGGAWVNLDVTFQEADGNTYTEERGYGFEYPRGPELWMQWINWDIDPEPEGDIHPETPQVTPLDEYHMAFYTCEDNGEKLTPVPVSQLKASAGVTIEPLCPGVKGKEAYAVFSVADWDKEYTISYGEFVIKLDSRLPDVGVYSKPEATIANFLRPWKYSPLNENAVAYLVSTNTDENNGRHLESMALSKDGEDNGSFSLEKVSDNVYKLTRKTVKGGREHIARVDVTWRDADGNTYTDFGWEFWAEAYTNALVSEKPIAGLPTLEDMISYDENKSQLSDKVTLKAGEPKTVYLAGTYCMEDEWVVYGFYPFMFSTSNSALKLSFAGGGKDILKYTLSCDVPGEYTINTCGMKMTVLDAKGNDISDTFEYGFDYDFEAGEWIVVEWDEATESVVPVDLDEEVTITCETGEVRGWFPITVTVTGEAATSTETTTGFPDVKATAWYAPAVAFASTNGYMNGNADGTFNPDGQVKGSEFAQILYNKEGKPAAADGAAFNGVADQWYAPAILWAAGKGIVTDAGDTAVAPTANLTRQQIALMLYNYMGKPAADADLSKFSDADKISGWALDAVKWAVSEGILKGNPDGTFNPTGTAKRSETAQILMNFFG